MSQPTQTDHKGITGGPLDINDTDVSQHMTDRELKGGTAAELDPDELSRLEATAEIARENSDAYLVRTDLEDADERGPSPGMKDQD